MCIDCICVNKHEAENSFVISPPCFDELRTAATNINSLIGFATSPDLLFMFLSFVTGLLGFGFAATLFSVTLQLFVWISESLSSSMTLQPDG
jgi:hypothetical protein